MAEHRIQDADRAADTEPPVTAEAVAEVAAEAERPGSGESAADTVTEVLLFVAVRRGGKPADPWHPLGYGRESYLWALLAAFATFVAGAVVSVLEGVDKGAPPSRRSTACCGPSSRGRQASTTCRCSSRPSSAPVARFPGVEHVFLGPTPSRPNP